MHYFVNLMAVWDPDAGLPCYEAVLFGNSYPVCVLFKRYDFNSFQELLFDFEKVNEFMAISKEESYCYYESEYYKKTYSCGPQEDLTELFKD